MPILYLWKLKFYIVYFPFNSYNQNNWCFHYIFTHQSPWNLLFLFVFRSSYILHTKLILLSRNLYLYIYSAVLVHCNISYCLSETLNVICCSWLYSGICSWVFIITLDFYIWIVSYSLNFVFCRINNSLKVLCQFWSGL